MSIVLLWAWLKRGGLPKNDVGTCRLAAWHFPLLVPKRWQDRLPDVVIALQLTNRLQLGELGHLDQLDALLFWWCLLLSRTKTVRRVRQEKVPVSRNLSLQHCWSYGHHSNIFHSCNFLTRSWSFHIKVHTASKGAEASNQMWWIGKARLMNCWYAICDFFVVVNWWHKSLF